MKSLYLCFTKGKFLKSGLKRGVTVGEGFTYMVYEGKVYKQKWSYKQRWPLVKGECSWFMKARFINKSGLINRDGLW